MAGTAVVTQLISIMVAGIQGLATGIGSGINDMVTSLFFTGSGESQTLSMFGTMVAVFAGIALAVGITKAIVLWCSKLGSSRI